MFCPMLKRGAEAPAQAEQRTGYRVTTEDKGIVKSQLPSELGTLSRLEQLVVSGNPLVSFPPEICHLSALQMIGLDRRQFTLLSEEMLQFFTSQNISLQVV